MASDFTIGVGIDMSDVAKQIATLPAMTSAAAEKSVREMTVAFNRAANEAKKLSSATKGASTGVDAVGRAAAKTAGASGKLAGALNMVSPELGAIVNGGKAAADVLEVMSSVRGPKLIASLGTLGVAAAAAGVAYMILSRDLDQATISMERSSEIAARVQAAHIKMEATQIDLAVATGQMTEEEGRAARGKASLSEQIAIATKHARDQQVVIAETVSSTLAWVEGVDRLTSGLILLTGPAGAIAKGAWEAAKSLTGLGDAGAKATAEAAHLEAGLTAEIAVLTRASSDTDALKDATDAKAEADRRAAGASKARAKVEAEALALAREQATATDTLTRIQQARSDALLSQGDLITEQAAREIEQINAITVAHSASEEIKRQGIQATAATVAWASGERAKLAEEARVKTMEIEAKSMEGLKSSITATDDLLSEHHAQRVEGAKAVAGALADLASDVSGALFAASEEQAKTNKKAAKRTFAVAKGLAIADIVVKTAQATMAVWSQWAAIPPVAAALSVATASMGALSAGKVAASQPKFHGGGVYSPDEGRATLRRGEGILTPQAVRNHGGSDGIRAMNRGQSPAPTRVVIDWRDGVKGLTRTTADVKRMRGSTLSDDRSYTGRNWDR